MLYLQKQKLNIRIRQNYHDTTEPYLQKQKLNIRIRQIGKRRQRISTKVEIEYTYQTLKANEKYNESTKVEIEYTYQTQT